MSSPFVPFFVLLLAAGAAFAQIPSFMSREGSSLPASTNALTGARRLEEYRAWRAKADVEAYDRFRAGTNAWDEAARALLRTNAAHHARRPPDGELKALLETADGLVAAGCQDPLVLYVRACLKGTFGGDAARLEPVFRSAHAALEESRYPARYKALAALALLEVLEALNRPDASVVRLGLWRRLGQEAADPAYAKGVSARHFMVLLDDARRSRPTAAQAEACWREVADKPGADAWLKSFLEGIWHLRKGWEAKSGGGRAGAELYLAELEAADKCLTRAYGLKTEFPEAAAELVSVTLARAEKARLGPRHWFELAVAAQFDYTPAYNNYLWALRPRWGGSHAAMRKFGEDCLKTGRFDTVVPWYYEQAVKDIATELDDWRDAYREPGVFENLTQLAGAALAREKTPEGRRYRKSHWAVQAWAGGKQEEGKRLLTELEGEGGFDPAAVVPFAVSAEQVRRELAGGAGEIPSPVRADRDALIRKVREGKDLNEAEKALSNKDLSRRFDELCAKHGKRRNYEFPEPDRTLFYMEAIKSGLIDEENNGGWPFRSDLRMVVLDQLKRVEAETHDPFAAFCAVFPALYRGEKEYAVRCMETLLARDPFLADKALRWSVENYREPQWLPDWYREAGRLDKALEIVEVTAAADYYSSLELKARLLDEAGRLAEAEAVCRGLEERHACVGPLTALFSRNRDKKDAAGVSYAKRLDELRERLFPGGLRKADLADLAGKPAGGALIGGDSAALARVGLREGMVVTGVDGFRVETLQQYYYLRDLDGDNPRMKLIVWDGTAYREVEAQAPRRRFGVAMLPFAPDR